MSVSYDTSRTWLWPSSVILVSALPFFFIGCNDGDPNRASVSGTITFNGQRLEEGSIFNERSSP